MRTGPARIVLAEDDRAIARLIEIALKRTKIPHELEIVYDGHQTIAAVQTPADLLLLDLYMPGKDGFEVLEYLKQHTHLRRMPVVMFSNSDLPAHVTKAYDLSVNAFVRKNTDFGEMCHTVDMILRFWLQIAVTPF